MFFFMAFHSGPVLSLAVTANGEQCFSGGIDSTIQWWNIPSSNIDPYDTYGKIIYCCFFMAQCKLFVINLVWLLMYTYLFMFISKVLQCMITWVISE